VQPVAKETIETMSIKAWGRDVLGIGEGAARKAAKRGEIPTVQIGKIRRVPVRRAMEELNSKKKESKS
jgi:hypothetical protein